MMAHQVEVENQWVSDLRHRSLAHDALAHFLAAYEQVIMTTPSPAQRHALSPSCCVCRAWAELAWLPPHAAAGGQRSAAGHEGGQDVRAAQLRGNPLPPPSHPRPPCLPCPDGIGLVSVCSTWR